MLKFFACVVVVGIILSMVAVLTVLAGMCIWGCWLELSEKFSNYKSKKNRENK